MIVQQTRWSRVRGWAPKAPADAAASAQLVLVFGGPNAIREPTLLAAVRTGHPQAQVLGCSTAGEICGTDVLNEAAVVTAIAFERTRVKMAWLKMERMTDSRTVGEQLAAALPAALPRENGGSDALTHVLVLSDGLHVNGSDLVHGLTANLPTGVTLTGGLAADGARFGETFVIAGGAPLSQIVAVAGLYGERLRVGFGSLGGWDPFGPERLVTRSAGNVLFQLDGHSALGLYKRYLGEHAAELPASGLLFPLSLRAGGETRAVVRTILAVSEEEQSMTFAGDVPEGSYARLMKANSDRLIDGAIGAARTGCRAIEPAKAELALLISCVGRKLVLRQRVEEEVEGVREVLGPQAVIAGFYSYGEISPFMSGARCELHNQTMAITTFAET